MPSSWQSSLLMPVLWLPLHPVVSCTVAWIISCLEQNMIHTLLHHCLSLFCRWQRESWNLEGQIQRWQKRTKKSTSRGWLSGEWNEEWFSKQRPWSVASTKWVTKWCFHSPPSFIWMRVAPWLNCASLVPQRVAKQTQTARNWSSWISKDKPWIWHV